MSDPALLTVLNEIGLRLANMTVAHGYAYDIGTVERARLMPFRIQDLPAVNYWPAFEEFKERKYGLEFRTADIRIEPRTITRDEPFTDAAFKLAQGVWIALNHDTLYPRETDDWSFNLGGLLTALELRLVNPVIGEGEAPWCGCMLNLAATYKVNPSSHVLTP